MRKRFLVLLSTIFVFGLFSAAFALNKTNQAFNQSQKHQTTQAIQTIDMKQVPVIVSDDDCCKPGADCCKGGSCCKKKK